MPSSFKASSTSSTRSTISIADADPITRNALRFTISQKEYALLHQYLISRTPILKEHTPKPAPPSANVRADEDHNAATVRATVRLFVATFAGLKTWEMMVQRLLGRAPVRQKTSTWKSPHLRLSLSLSSILLFHRLLHRFFMRLRESLRGDDAKPFRRRNPRIARALTSKLAPAVGASFAGFFLGVCPADQTRLSITIYAFARALEFLYNALEEKGYFRAKPSWVGSWLLMPISCAQLLHAIVFDRDCFPASYGKFILDRSPEYIQQRPTDYPLDLPYPSTFSIVDSLAIISDLKWPSFISPILFPNSKTLPSALSFIAPITDPAHPAIHHLSCAILHPHDPSCLRTFLKYYMTAFPTMAKFFTLLYTVLSLPRYRAFLDTPLTALNVLAARILRTSFFLTSAIGTAWASICLFQHILPPKLLPTSRWYISGFLAGLWAFLERGSGRGNFLYSMRASIDSLWKVGTKRGWWRGIGGGDVAVFVVSLMVVNVVYERDARAVQEGLVRKGLGILRGDGWVDRVGGRKEANEVGEVERVDEKENVV